MTGVQSQRKELAHTKHRRNTDQLKALRTVPGLRRPLPGREERGAIKAAFPITQAVREQICFIPFSVILKMLLSANDRNDGVAEVGAQGQLVRVGSVGTEGKVLQGGHRSSSLFTRTQHSHVPHHGSISAEQRHSPCAWNTEGSAQALPGSF